MIASNKPASDKKTALVCCETIRDEIILVLGTVDTSPDLYWIESGLHNSPERLRSRLQETLDSLDGQFDRVLLAFGFCGNAIIGIETRGFELIFPRVDDCISLLLGSDDRRREIGETGTYFFTRGWLLGEENMWNEYQFSVETYGEEAAKMIYDSMLAHYSRLGILDTGAYDLSELEATTQLMAETFELEHTVIPAGTAYIGDLLSGVWDPARFVITPPHSTVTA